MVLSRRNFIRSGVTAIAAAPVVARTFDAVSSTRIRAVAFDAFAIFDPRPVSKSIIEYFPEKGTELAQQWRTSQFEYSWLRTAASQYKDFWELTRDALVFAAKKSQVVFTSSDFDKMMDQYLHLNTWPDVGLGLNQLRKSGLRLGFLSNFTGAMLEKNIQHSRLEGYFNDVISTDESRTYKPDPKAYELARKKMQLRKEEILFVAFAGWDACGANWFGYPTFWLNRLQAPDEQLDVPVGNQGATFKELLHFINKSSNR